MFFEMHKHSHYSMWDGFDRINNIVAYAKELGHKAVGLSDHGNACGIIQLYNECKKQGLKPLMGVEAYFNPKTLDEEHHNEYKHYHLCLYAYNQTGYHNLCKIITEANEEQNFYAKMHVTFENLEKHSDGIICTSACIAGMLSQAVLKGKPDMALKIASRFKEIFEDNYYIEIQPIKIDDEGTQEKINKRLMKVADKLGIKTIITTDSHYTRPSDFDSYLMMHKMSKLGASGKGEGFTIEHIEQTYKERYMYSEEEICGKFVDMFGFYPKEQLEAMDEIYDKIDIELDFSHSIPLTIDYDDPDKAILEICKKKLKEKGKWNKKYIERTKYELGVIKGHDLSSYFLIVMEYVQWAKDHGIYVGPGRGSCGGSLVTDLLNITEIDPIEVGTDFDRFLRPDKKKMPDIDMDFENGRQQEVIQHIIQKYKGRASKITTFGYYKSTNLINDLCKIYGIEGPEVARIKGILKRHVPEMAHFEFEDVDFNEVMKDPLVRDINKEYEGFVKHFCLLCGQVKYYGQHPAGVLVTRTEIGEWVPMMRIKGQMICSYDKYDCEGVDMVKFDVLALKTLNVIKDIEQATGDVFDRNNIDEETHKKMYDNFADGNTLGIFQLNKDAARNILRLIKADTLQDVIAAISLNRPGALQLKTHEAYAKNKKELDTTTIWYPYTKDAYGSIIYQEHVMRICKGLANMPPERIDKLMKFKFNDEERGHLKEEFVAGCKEHSGLPESQTGPLFDAMALYLFNKGHGAGYALICEWMMYHKVKHPTEFWFASLKWEYDESKKAQCLAEAVRDGSVIFLPHVNYSADYTIRKVDGESVIQEGYNTIPNVGPTAAKLIQEERTKNGPFRSYDDFVERCKSRSVTSRVISSLLEAGALEFNKKVYLKRVTQYNTALYTRSLR